MAATKRPYNDSHPWLRFSFSLDKLSWETLSLLGEIRARVQHVASVAIRPATAQKLHRLYLAKGAMATTAIEGNTLSEEEVNKLLLGELKLPPSKEYLGTEVKNILRACDTIVREAIGSAGTTLRHKWTSGRIKEFNKWVRDGLPESEDVAPPGQIRTYSVGVARYRGAPAGDCEYLLDRLCDWLTEMESPDQKVEQFKLDLAVIRAVLAHVYLAWIHPFGDGNGRTARLMEFDLLIKAGFPPPCAHLLSNHYNETRSEYYRQLDYASRSGGDLQAFMKYAIQGLADGLRAQEEVIGREQLDIAWRNFVHERFRDRTTKAGFRQKRLVLDLSRRNVAAPASRLAQLTPVLAAAYAGKTRKTLQRDLNALVEEKLILRVDKEIFNAKEDLYCANTSLIMAFQPPTSDRSLPMKINPENLLINVEDLHDGKVRLGDQLIDTATLPILSSDGDDRGDDDGDGDGDGDDEQL